MARWFFDPVGRIAKTGDVHMANEITGFRFNGLGTGQCLADLARDATGLEISPVWCIGTGDDAEVEVTSTDQAGGWSVYLRLVKGEARVLHDARTLAGAARALVAANRGYGFPVQLAAWDMCCEAESLRDLPEALRREVRYSVAFRLREAHAGFALAAWIDLARHQAARENKEAWWSFAIPIWGLQARGEDRWVSINTHMSNPRMTRRRRSRASHGASIRSFRPSWKRSTWSGPGRPSRA